MIRTGPRSRIAEPVVLAGWAAKAVVYAALTWLVLQLAFGRPPRGATTQGALEYVVATTNGRTAMLVLVGLLAFAVGRNLEATVLAT